MAEDKKKLRLIYYNDYWKQWIILKFEKEPELIEWLREHPKFRSTRIRFIVGLASGHVSYDTLEEAISAANGDKTLVKPKVPEDLPQEAMQMLYNLI